MDPLRHSNNSTEDSATQHLTDPLLTRAQKTDMELQKEEESSESIRKTLLGYILMMMFVMSNALGDSVLKLLYVNHSNLGVIEMMFARGVIVMLLMVFLINRNYQEILWQCLVRNKKMIFPLFVRVNSGLLAFFCINQAIKHLPLVLVALFTNTLPLFCSLLGFLILGEKITKAEIICLLIAFYGIYVLLYYGDTA